MEEERILKNLNYSGSFLRNSNNNGKTKIYSVCNSVNNGQNEASDLQKLSSRIICSANITRQSLNQKAYTLNTSNDDDCDDNDEFLKKLKDDIDRDLLLHSKENYKPTIIHQDTFSLKKKRPVIDKETQNVIKRFKKDTSHTNVVQLAPPTTSTKQFNHVIDSVIKKPYSLSTNTNVAGYIMGEENIFTSNTLNKHFRSPPSKYIFQMSSKVQKNNILPLPTNGTTVIHTEFEEYLFYAMTCFTPPDSDSSQDE